MVQVGIIIELNDISISKLSKLFEYYSDVGPLDNLLFPQPFQQRSFQDQETEKWKSCAGTKSRGRERPHSTVLSQMRQLAPRLRLIMGGN